MGWPREGGDDGYIEWFAGFAGVVACLFKSCLRLGGDDVGYGFCQQVRFVPLSRRTILEEGIRVKEQCMYCGV